MYLKHSDLANTRHDGGLTTGDRATIPSPGHRSSLLHVVGLELRLPGHIPGGRPYRWRCPQEYGLIGDPSARSLGNIVDPGHGRVIIAERHSLTNPFRDDLMIVISSLHSLSAAVRQFPGRFAKKETMFRSGPGRDLGHALF